MLTNAKRREKMSNLEKEKEEFYLASVNAKIQNRLQTRTEEEAELAILALGFPKTAHFEPRIAEIA
jgi:hypothetical protein